MATRPSYTIKISLITGQKHSLTCSNLPDITSCCTSDYPWTDPQTAHKCPCWTTPVGCAQHLKFSSILSVLLKKAQKQLTSLLMWVNNHHHPLTKCRHTHYVCFIHMDIANECVVCSMWDKVILGIDWDKVILGFGIYCGSRRYHYGQCQNRK